MVMCDRRELLVDLMRHPGRLYPIRADSRTEFPDLGLPMQSVEGEGPCALPGTGWLHGMRQAHGTWQLPWPGEGGLDLPHCGILCSHTALDGSI